MKQKVNKFIRNRSRELKILQSPIENLLWQRIRNNQIGYKFRRQHPFGDKYILDFVCLEKKLVIELDGGEHGFKIEEDAERDRFLDVEGFKVIRFGNNEIFDNIDRCLDLVVYELGLR